MHGGRSGGGGGGDDGAGAGEEIAARGGGRGVDGRGGMRRDGGGRLQKMHSGGGECCDVGCHRGSENDDDGDDLTDHGGEVKALPGPAEDEEFVPQRGEGTYLPTCTTYEMNHAAVMQKQPESISSPDCFFVTHSRLWLS